MCKNGINESIEKGGEIQKCLNIDDDSFEKLKTNENWFKQDKTR